MLERAEWSVIAGSLGFPPNDVGGAGGVERSRDLT